MERPERPFEFDESSADGNKIKQEGPVPVNPNSKKRPMNQADADDKVCSMRTSSHLFYLFQIYLYLRKIEEIIGAADVICRRKDTFVHISLFSGEGIHLKLKLQVNNMYTISFRPCVLEIVFWIC